MLNFLKSLRQDDRGVTALEYAVLAGVLLVAIIAALKAFDVGALFETLFGKLETEINGTSEP